MNLKLFRQILIFFGPFLGGISFVLLQQLGLSFEAAATAGITIWVALWWIFEPIPIPATSLIPFAAFPLAGVLSNKDIATAYGHWLILLLLGGFILSSAMERSGVHRRIAMGIIRVVGGRSSRKLILGMMISTAFLSGWISNTATCLMMLPVALALCEEMPGPKGARALLLGLAYSASIGGIATPIGTPPNVVLMGVYKESTGNEIPFLDWMMMGYPIAIVLLFFAWLYLTLPLKEQIEIDTKRLKSATQISPHEKRILIVFGLTASAWITRTQPFGGWSGYLNITTVGDDTVALGAAALVFVIPDGKGSKLLDWETASKIPWGLLILFGGGIGIAKAFSASGLSTVIGDQLSAVTTLPLLLMIAVICLAVTFLTEMTSNTATTALLMPILAATAISSEIDPLYLMVPAAISASCAFMLPVATAPNAIVFGTGQISSRDMAQWGLGLNLIGVLIISICCKILL